MKKELSTLDQYLTDPSWANRISRKQAIEKSDAIF